MFSNELKTDLKFIILKGKLALKKSEYYVCC